MRVVDGQGDVLADGALHEQGLGAIGRDVDEAGPDRVGGMVERDGRAVHEQLAAARALGAGEDVEQLVLALALERDHAEHLARVEVEGRVVQLGAEREPARRQARLGAGGPRAPVAARPPPAPACP